MKLHANAKTCPDSRRLLVRRIEAEGWPLMKSVEGAGISGRSASKWLARWRAEGEAGPADRSSAPRRVAHRTPADRVSAIECSGLPSPCGGLVCLDGDHGGRGDE